MPFFLIITDLSSYISFVQTELLSLLSLSFAFYDIFFCMLLFLVARETENQSNEIGKVLSSDVGAAETDHNCHTASFLSPLDTKDCANKNMSGFDDDWLINSRSQEQTADIRLDKLKSGSVSPSMKCSSSPEAASYGKDHGNCDFLKSSCNVL